MKRNINEEEVKLKKRGIKDRTIVKDFFFFVLSLYKFPDKMILVDDVVYNLSTIKR